MNTSGNKSCLGCLIQLVLGIAALLLTVLCVGYMAVMHSSLPFRMVTGIIESSGTNVNLRISGISGSISSGFGVKSIQWTGGTISDVRVKYSGWRDLMYKKELVLTEVNVGQAHIDMTDWTSDQSPTNSEPGDISAASSNTSVVETTNKWPLQLFQIDRLAVRDVVLTNRTTGFFLSVPSVEWTGFKVSKEFFEFGSLSIDSDRLKVVTKDIQSGAMQKHIDLTMLPRLHPSIRRTIVCSIDVGRAGSNTVFRVSAFEGKLHMEKRPDDAGFLRCSSLDLTDYFDAPLPQELTIDMSFDANTAKLSGGTCRLGMRKFEFPAQVLSGTNSLFAVSRDNGQEMRYILDKSDDMPGMRQRLVAQPECSKQDALAIVYHGKRFAELSPADQAEITRRVFWFEPKK